MEETVAQVATSPALLVGFGVALVVLAAAWGIGWIGSSAMNGIARQPEAAGDIRTTMILSCALIEGVAFFGVVVCLLVVLLK